MAHIHNFKISLPEKGDYGKMDAKKIVTIAVDASAGFIIALMGFEMTPFPLNMIWGTFNIWLWIASPTLVLWAKNEEDEKKLLNRKL
jgi:hypothetical protein